MTPFDIACPHCERKMRVKNEALLNRKVRCPNCQQPFIVEDPSAVEAEAFEGAGSGVGSEVVTGSKVGGSGRVPSASTFLRSLGAKPSDNDQDVFDEIDVSQADDDDEDVAAESDVAPVRPTRPAPSKGKSAAPRKSSAKNDAWMTYALAGGIPAGIGLVIMIGILISKGYLGYIFGFGGGLHRQDSSRFAEFGRSIDVEKEWKSGAPTGLETSVDSELRQAERRLPGAHAAIARLRSQYDKAKVQHGNGRLSNVEYQQRLTSIATELRVLVANETNVDPDALGGGRSLFGN